MWRLDALYGLAGVLTLAYGLDRWTRSLRETGLVNFKIGPYLWGTTAANLLLAMLIMALAAYILSRPRRSRLVAWLYLLIGLILALLPIALATIPASFSFLWSPSWRTLRISLMYSAPTSRLTYTSALIAAIGLMDLLPRDHRWRERLSGTLARFFQPGIPR